MSRLSLMILASMAVSLSLSAATPRFTAKPTISRDGERAVVQFEVDRETDVAVYVQNDKGEVVRHLAAGVLGENAPAPLKPGLRQSIAWDGLDDDGKKAEGAPFKVRVALGLKANWGGTAFQDYSGPNHVSSVLGMVAGPDGRVYVTDSRSAWLYWYAAGIHVFRRDGSYEKTIKPFPGNLPPEKLADTKAFVNKRGYLNPFIHRPLGMTFYPYEDEPARQMGMTPDGRLILTVVPSWGGGGRRDTRAATAHLACIDGDGGVPGPTFAGPSLGGMVYKGTAGRDHGPVVQVGAKGKKVFITGLGHRYYNKGYRLKKHPVIYQAPLPAMGPASVFFGDKEKPGSDQTHLNDPRGMALDGKGHLLVADFGNNRVVVLKEADASFVGSFAVTQPEWIGVHPRTGAVYVYSPAKNVLLKFSGWKNAKQVASQELSWVYRGVRKDLRYRQRLSFALEASAEPARIWVGNTMVSPFLGVQTDLGSSFGKLEPAGCFTSVLQGRPASDPTHRMVLCDTLRGLDRIRILDEATGKIRRMRRPAGGNNQGIHCRLDRHGNLYCAAAGGGLWKHDTKGTFAPFPATANDPKLKGYLPAGSTGTTAWERDWYVDRKGDIYAKVRGGMYHGLMHVDVFGPDGKKKRTAIWGVTDGSYGPKVDARGNLYMMECVKPLGQAYPDELKPHIKERRHRHWYDWIYGSIVKFTPRGGNIWLKPRNKTDKPKADPVELPDNFKKEKVYCTFRQPDSILQGALWMMPGVAHCGDMGCGAGGEHCHCTGCDFDVDNFGRVFAPDNGRQRVTVLDTNGNLILHFGAYGNQDYCGPESYVMDPKGKFLRPRKPDDPRDLKSPFANPEIAFNWITGLAVTDRHAYVADCANRRMLRVKLGYASTETCEIK